MPQVTVDDIKTAPRDKRFPGTNQALHCWTLYNEWIVCLNKNDQDEDACKHERWKSRCICPGEWMERWDDQREEGKFAGIQSTASEE